MPENNFYIASGARDALCERFSCDRGDISFALDAGEDGKLFITADIYRQFSMTEGYTMEHHRLDLTDFADYMNVEIN